MEVMRHSYTSIPEQMGAALMRSAFSPNIKERKDESCAIFNPEAGMLAQAEHIPVHLGAMPRALEQALDECDLGKNDQIILNDPYKGGTHLPDITLAKPVYFENKKLGYVVNRAHHSDVGGDIPGSMPGNTEELEEEGIVISPQKIVEDGEIIEKVMDLLKETRSPKERIGDIRAQLGANEKGSRDFIETTKKFGFNKYQEFVEEFLEYSEKRTHNMIKELPNGEYSNEDYMEWQEEDIKLKVKLIIENKNLEFNFEGTNEQIKGNINAPFPVVLSSVYYVLRCLLPKEVPLNAGTYKPIKVNAPKGSLLNPEPPAAVSAGNVETSQRIVELILGALRPIIPEKIPAESMGTMNNLAIGNDEFTYYETIGGGSGASKNREGADGVHVHMTNTKNTPIEALENYYPLRVKEYRLRENSGGKGKRKGGEGIIRKIESLEPAFLSMQSERRRLAPKGSNGGENAKIGENKIIKEDSTKEMPGKFSEKIESGDIILVKTPGGGGWGSPDKDHI